MTILKTDTVSGIGTEGTVFEGDITVDSLNYMTLPKGTTDQRYSLEGRDPDYHKLKLHLPLVQHTQFDDYSPASPSIEAKYESHISSKSGVFENSAALFSRQAANDWIAISDSNDLDLGTDDFTIECWFMCAGGGTDGNIIQKGYNAGTWSYIISFKQATDSINFYGTSDGTNFDIVNGTSFGSTILPNRWYHVAVCRSGNTFSYYINGEKGSTEDTSSASLYNSNIEMRIKEPSGFGGTEDVFIQDVRLYKGVAKYSETFTPQKLAEVGATRYNTDSNKIECYDGTKWMNIAVSSPDLNGGGRALMGGGHTSPADVKVIDYVNIASAGNAQDFGDIMREQRHSAGLGSSTRGFFSGGYKTSNGGNNAIVYVTFSTTGDATDFGDTLNGSSWSHGCMSNATRGIVVGGAGANDNTMIQYFTMASTGDAVDFAGNIYANRDHTCVASATRGVITGGHDGTDSQAIKFITITTTGVDAQDFGNLTQSIHSNYSNSTGSSSTRGVFGPKSGMGYEYVTFATKGNSIDFGDPRDGDIGSSTFGTISSTTRMLTAGGRTPSQDDAIEYFSIQTGGLAVDFGNLTAARETPGGCSNAHGGL